MQIQHTNRYVLILLTQILLVGCQNLPGSVALETPTRYLTTNPSPLNTPVSTSTRTSRPPDPTIQPTATKTVTPTTIVYPIKQVLVSYLSGIGNHSFFEIFFNYTENKPRLLLYSDGLLLLSAQEGYLWQKVLTKDEIDHLIRKLEGFRISEIQVDPYSSIEDNPLYNFQSGDYQEVFDGTYTQIMVNGEDPFLINISEFHIDYITEPVKQILNYLNNYSPTGLVPYESDRLLLYIMNDQDRMESTDDAPIPWPENVTPLINQSRDYYLYFTGEEATEIYRLASSNKGHIFSQDGIEYFVLLYPILPERCRMQTYNCSISTTQPDFSCTD